MIGGTITEEGDDTPTARIYWGTNDGGIMAGNWTNVVSKGEQSGSFDTGLTGLTPGQRYYFRCYAVNIDGYDWAPATGSWRCPEAPTVENGAATDITQTGATLHGEVTDTGSGSEAEGGTDPTVYIYYGTSDGGTTPASWDTEIAVGQVGLGPFESATSVLLPDTGYFYRCKAVGPGGTGWASSSAEFTTLAVAAPVVRNDAATDITTTGAKLGGTITDDGGGSCSAKVYWGTSDGGTTAEDWDTEVDVGGQTEDVAFQTQVVLSEDTTHYFYRCWGTNAGGSSWAPVTAELFTVTAPDQGLPDVSELEWSSWFPDYKPIYRDGPKTPKQIEHEFRNLTEYLALAKQEATVVGNLNLLTEKVQGGTGLSVGMVVYFAAPGYIMAAARNLSVDRAPLAVIVEVVGRGWYRVRFGGRLLMRVSGAVSAPQRLMLSATAGVAETASSANVEAVGEGEFVWPLGVGVGAIEDGLIESVAAFSATPMMEF